jgi:GT2 family glycosyltransferase
VVDVIVPVHGAGSVFRRCAASLIAHARGDRRDAAASYGATSGAVTTDEAAGDAPASDAAFRLVIVLDGPPDAESLVAVEELRAAAWCDEGGRAGSVDARECGFELEVLTHEEPLGFLRSANRAMRSSSRDVVLLNSDTQVTAGWLGRLRDAAYSHPKIATVTPFSNNATICSLPRFLAENAIPAGHTIDSFGELVTRVSRREYPRLPTGVGFCLYVKRSVLDELGLFDEAFGLGYGEEVDLCFRAARRGYVHVLDDATFVYHEGSRSFGRRREQRQRRGERMMRERYPEYVREISGFIANDPIAPARARVLDELRTAERVDVSVARAPRRVLHVVQGWPPWANGEAEEYARAVVQEQGARREVFVYARMGDPDRALGSAVEYVDGGVRVRLIVNNFTQRDRLSRFGLRSRQIAADFEKFVDDVEPDLVHVHQLSRHAINLLDVAHRRRLPIVYELRDWWPICARGDLVDRDGAPCSGPRVTKCARCLPIAQLPAAAVAPSSVLFYSVRARRMRAALANVDAFVMGSQSIADRYAAARVLPPSARVHVMPREEADIERVYEEVMSQRAL